MSSLLMKDKGCLLLCKKKKKRRPFLKLGHPVQSNQMVTLFVFWGFFFGGGELLFELDYFLSKFCPSKRGEIRWCVRGKKERRKTSRKPSVISHVTNWIASNRKSVAIASDKPLSRETAGSWQTRGNLKGTEAFGCKLTLDIKHLTSFYFRGETCLKPKPYACTSKYKSFL